MKKLLLVLLFPFAALANPIDTQCPQFVVRGAPVSSIKANDQYLCKGNYAIHYRYDTKTAEYVVEHITLPTITGPAKRKDDFRPDPAVPKQHQSQLSDYAGAPYDRGHLSPGADNNQNDQMMSESFFLSNMVPQVPNNNRGIWKQLETWERNWVEEGRDLYIISGGIYDAGHLVIGNGVGVPTRLYKVIFDKQKGTGVAYLMPNAPLPVEDLPKYQVTIKDVEKETGMNFNLTAPKAKK
jgi:endonuclease G